MSTSAFVSQSSRKQMVPPAESLRGTMLEAGAIPIEDLALLAQREGQRPRAVYQAHRWFARRFGSAFRALLIAASLSPEDNLWDAYYAGTDWHGRILLDPFVGGGTSVVEAQRLGADIIGVDVDSVACAITRFEARMIHMPDVLPSLQHLKTQVANQLAPYYRTVTAKGEPREVLHFFWVQVVECPDCGHKVEAHPHYQLAYEAEGSQQWVFCPQCHDIQILDRTAVQFTCPTCAITTSIRQGTVQYGRLTCCRCGRQQRLIDVAGRTGRAPAWKLFALETVDPVRRKGSAPMAMRHFQPAREYDFAILAAVEQALRERREPDGHLPWVPERLIPLTNRSDNRLPEYGYRRYHELFNSRQLLHLSVLAEAIDQFPEPVREALALAFSDHLITNCMMTQYAFGWRRLTPLFSVRAYRHVPRPVEINPWMDGTGRGTYPNAVRQVQRAIASARAPKEPVLGGGFRATPSITANQSSEPPPSIVHGTAQRMGFIADATVDFILTDPPYFDNIAYSELSDFFLPWLQLFGLAPEDDSGVVALRESLAANTRAKNALREFESGLTASFREMARVLKQDGRLVFTFQQRTAGAWKALARALAQARFRSLQVFPMLGDSTTGLHKHRGSSKWDAVFVCTKAPQFPRHPTLKLSHMELDRSQHHYDTWVRRLESSPTCQFEEADKRNFYRACLVASALGLHEMQDAGRRTLTLQGLLEADPPDVARLAGGDRCRT